MASKTSQSDGQYNKLIANTINRRKKRQQKISGDKQKAIEFEEKYRHSLKINDKLEKHVNELKDKCRDLQLTISRKEALYRDSINQVHGRMNSKNGDQFRLEHCQEIHNQILSHLEDKKYSTKTLILEKEKELIRDYEQKISELRLEVQRLKTRNMQGTDEWITKIRKLEEENLWMKQVSDKIQTENKKVSVNNSTLNQQISTLEADREFLIKQVIAIKKENKHLHLLMTENNQKSRQSVPNDENLNTNKIHFDEISEMNEFGAIDAVPSSSRSHKSTHSLRPRTSISARNSKRNQLRIRPKSAMNVVNANYSSFSHYHTVDSETAKNEIDDRYNAVIGQLKKQLNSEKKKSQQIEYKLNQHLSQQNELQTFLKHCIDDVQSEVTQYMKQQRNRQNLPSPPVRRGRKKRKSTRPKSALTAGSRKRKAKKVKRVPIWSHREHGEQTQQRPESGGPGRIGTSPSMRTHNATLDEMRSEFSLQRLDQDDKKQVLRKLLTKDKILHILYAEMFPTARSIITNKFDRKSSNPVQLSNFAVEDFVRRRDEAMKKRMSETVSEEDVEQKEQQIEFVKKIASSAFD